MELEHKKDKFYVITLNLVMTTNFKDKLDPALLRPGRADFHAEFKLASHN